MSGMVSNALLMFAVTSHVNKYCIYIKIDRYGCFHFCFNNLIVYFWYHQTVNMALHQTPGDLASLTVVMRAVGQVSSEHAHLHTALLDVRQMFHTLHIYGIQVRTY